MARIKIELPNDFPYSTTMVVRISDINYGNHLGNDSMLNLLHEARLRYLNRFGFSEMRVGEGVGLIMKDVAIVFQNEARHGMTLRFDLAAVEPTRTGFEILYRVWNKELDIPIVEAKTAMVFYNYEEHKVARMPDGFRIVFES